MERNPLINLFIGYFEHQDKDRQKEIDKTLEKNLANPLIDRVICFDETPFLADNKLIKGPSGRPTYQTFFDYSKNYPHDINIIANSDIYFDKSIDKAREIDQNTCYALTRHEINNEGKLEDFQSFNNCPAHFSQDVWIFKGEIKAKNCEEVVALNVKRGRHDVIKFNLGIAGCDNVIAFKLRKYYQLKNPYNDIKAIHLHRAQTRPNYSHRITGDHSKWGQLMRVPISGL